MRLWAFLCTLVGSFLLGSFLLMLVLPPFRAVPAQILVENDHPERGGEAIVLLMGDAEDRAKHAAELLREGYGETIVFVEAEEDELQKAGVKPREGRAVYDYLTKALKVPAGNIVFDDETRVSSTEEEVRAILLALEKRHYTRNILATSWYHSSRAGWIFRKVMAEHKDSKLTLQSLPSPMPEKWYKREKDFLNVYNEYLKWVYYYLKYEILT